MSYVWCLMSNVKSPMSSWSWRSWQFPVYWSLTLKQLHLVLLTFIFKLVSSSNAIHLLARKEYGPVKSSSLSRVQFPTDNNWQTCNIFLLEIWSCSYKKYYKHINNELLTSFFFKIVEESDKIIIIICIKWIFMPSGRY